MRLLWLPDKLRAWGLNVVEDPGWRDRGKPFPGMPEVVVAHHTATSARAKGDLPTLQVLRDGRHDLPGPLCQLGLGRSGKVWVIASGIGNHAGHGGWDGVDVGNSRSIGIEAEHDGIGGWTPQQRDAYDRLCAALLDGIGQPASRLAAHKETALPRGRKTDPNLDMDDMRRRVHALLARPYTAKTTDSEEFVMASKAEVQQLLDDAVLQITGGRRARTADGQVVDPDSSHVSNADVVTALERLGDRIVAEIRAAR